MAGPEFDLDEYVKQADYHQQLTGTEEPAAERRGLSRRDLLVKGGVGAVGLAGLGSIGAAAAAAATAKSGKFTGTLNVLSLGVEWPQGVQQQAEKDLGFKFKVTLASSVAQVQKAITAPESFDIFGGYNYQFFQIWPSGNMLPIDTTKINAWPKLYTLFANGKLNPSSKQCTYGDGDAPFRATFLDIDGSTGLPLTKEGPASNKQIVQWIDEKTGKPYPGKPMPRYVIGPTAHFNMDSMGYNGDVIKKAPGQVSWANLLNKTYAGRVAVIGDPGIGMQDLGMAVKALGLMKFKDLGNMTRAEMDKLMKILSTYKKAGQFRAFWATFNESVNLMASKEVVIESMWSPAVALLVAQGVNVRYAAPKEGFRGWSSAQGISAKVTDPAKLQACYDYLNWMYDGYLGAAIMRQGYYIGNGNDLLPWIKSAKGKALGFSSDEYDFWYGGKAAARDLPGIQGKVGDVKKGQVRDGGSFATRACHYATWNSYFRENVYQLKRWNQFLSS
jgi:putative spermidine/putrescine transport system substrate-binding protein